MIPKDAGTTRPPLGDHDAATKPAPNIFEEQAASNLPNAKVVYGGTESPPGLTVLGMHLELDSSGPELQARWYVRLRNDFNGTLCSSLQSFQLLDTNGAELISFDPLPDLHPYDNGTGTADCVGSQEIFYVSSEDPLVQGVSAFALQDVATVQWTYRVAGYLDVFSPATYASLTDLHVTPDSLGGYALSGTMQNGSSIELQFPSVAAYVLNAGGQPLARLFDNIGSGQTVPAYSSWTFQAGRFEQMFSVSDLDILPDYRVY